MPKYHDLKIQPEYYKEIVNRTAHCEIRLNDCNFQLGDFLELKEWNPEGEYYTGLEIMRRISFILHDDVDGIEKGYCIMSIE